MFLVTSDIVTSISALSVALVTALCQRNYSHSTYTSIYFFHFSDSSESRPDVSIERDQLVIKWKPRTECLLQTVTVKILRNGALWMTYNFTDGSQKATTSVPRSNAIYAVSVEFSYAGLFVERSDYIVINYETGGLEIKFTSFLSHTANDTLLESLLSLPTSIQIVFQQQLVLLFVYIRLIRF